jgi:Tol biopolymer transport system component
MTVTAICVIVAACDERAGSPTGTPTDDPVPSGTITATGKIMFISAGGDLTLINPDGSSPQPVTQGGGIKTWSWSADGSLIAFERSVSGASVVEVIRPDGAAVFELPGASAPVWSPPGNRLLVTRGDGLEAVDAAGQSVRSIATAIRGDWSPDGTSLAFIRTTGDGLGIPMIMNLQDGNEQPLDAAIAPGETFYRVLWHPAGEVLAYRDALYEPATGAKTTLPGIVAFFSPDGRTALVTLGPDPTVDGTPARLLDLNAGYMPIIGLDVRPAPDGTPPWLYIDRWTGWSPSGRLLIYLDPDATRPRVRLYDTAGPQQQIYRNIRGETPEFAADGRFVTFTYEGKVWVFPIDASALVAIVEGSLPKWQP